MAVVAAAVLLAGQQYGLPVRAATASPSAAQLEGALRFRHAFGLPTDVGALASAASEGESAYGIPLTARERADMDRRVAVQQALGPLESYIAAHSDDFGGIWLDQAQGGAVVIEPVVGGAADVAAARRLAPAAAVVVVQPVMRSMSALQRLRDAVAEDEANLASAGVRVEGTGIDPMSNSVQVGVSGPTAYAEDLIAGRYDGAVQVVPQEPLRLASLPTSCTSRSVCPLRAGLDISNISYMECTAGYFFRVNGGSSVLYSTAGHCWSDTFTSWYLGVTTTYYIGVNYEKSYYSGMSADAMLMTQASTASKNLIYVSSSQPGRSVTTWTTNTSQTVGSIACAVGRVSGYQCGTINGVNLAENVPAGIEYHLWRVNFPSGDGDSGGPVFYGSSAMGLTTATDGTSTYYSTIEWIDSVFGVTPCITTSC